jgi:hypothetical protein
MYVARAFWPSSNGKTYQSIYLRESYRDGDRVRKRDIANLTHCDPKEIAAIELALQFKGNLAALGSLDKIQLSQGPSVGAVWVIVETARRLGMEQALGRDFAAQLALWQVAARVLDQGSRLSAVRLAHVHAACDVVGIRRGFDENDLDAKVSWVSEHQEGIVKRLFSQRRGAPKPELFLYDVTSSYLEGGRQCLRRLRLQPRREKGQEADRHRPVVRRTRHAGLDGGFSRQHARSKNLCRASKEGE